MIPHNKPFLGEAEARAAYDAVKSGWVAPGPRTEAFEEAFCAFHGLPKGHAVAVSSGTAALFLALLAVGAKGKKTAIPAYACSSLRHACALSGAQELICDIKEGTPNLDFDKALALGAQVVIAPHIFGLPAPIPQKSPVPVVEDCAQALGAVFEGRPSGLSGDISVFSFYATKVITSAGQGGMVASRDKALADFVRDYILFDQRREFRPRFNLQMTDTQAAVGLVQLKKLPAIVSRRSEIFAKYRAAGAQLLDADAQEGPQCRPLRFRAVLKTDKPAKVLAHFAERGIRAIVPIEDWELLAPLPNSLRLSAGSVSIPLYPALSEADVDAVCAALKSL